ncbi:hypothetical protein [uncultured Microbacterium sp.]|uniref:hypothetical protein n=1 Tax=uncultured Microbacterium sp. TaxID=191216 RepID=UPI0025D5492F|nr:hypothetical protein [uncultured Microbacterium sp.]
MNTLTTSAPAQATRPRAAHPPHPQRRTGLLDRAAMRLGLWLLLWSRRPAQPRETAAADARTRAAHDAQTRHDALRLAHGLPSHARHQHHNQHHNQNGHRS